MTVAGYWWQSYYFHSDARNICGIRSIFGIHEVDINYESKRYLIYDDTELTINSPSGEASKYNFGGGIKILLTDYLLLTASTTMDVVDDDGFDGWDYGTNIDKFSYHSVGLTILF